MRIQHNNTSLADPSKRGAATYVFRTILGVAGITGLIFVVPPLVTALAAAEPAPLYTVGASSHRDDNIQTTQLLSASIKDALPATPTTGALAGFLQSQADGSFTEQHANIRGEISVYVVREGDTLSEIAGMFDVSQNTILWMNDIKRADLIKPGMILNILPVTGVRHTVTKGDTLSSIAKAYHGDTQEIAAYNQIETLKIGDTIVIPNGRIDSAPATSRANAGTAYAMHLIRPIVNAVKTQGIHGHNAVDLAGPFGEPIRAAAAGKVIISAASGYNGGYGQYIVIKHPNGVQTLYSHLSKNLVQVGQTVSQGQTIGEEGNTGRSTGPHLHFEVRGAVNPF